MILLGEYVRGRPYAATPMWELLSSRFGSGNLIPERGLCGRMRIEGTACYAAEASPCSEPRCSVLLRRVSVLALFAVSLSWMLLAQSPAEPPGTPLSPSQQLAREILKELIEINTTDSAGDVTRAAEAMASRLKAAGFPAGDIQVLGPRPRKGNLVARLRGTGAGKPILLLAHLDVVEARRDDWSFDPFTFIERDGYYYGRGTSDVKDGAAVLIANLIRLRQEGFKPDRDLIVALTADEEGGPANGVAWLLQNHRDLIEADYCLNTDGGGGEIRNGKRIANELQTSEKVYLSFGLETKNRGGHSSLPVRDNAIYHLAGGLTRLAQFEFPVRLNETTRAFFERMSGVETGDVARDMKAVAHTPPDPAAVSRLAATSPLFNALMRTTCVATELEAGHAENALPQTARAVVNCRILPDESPQEVWQTLVRVLDDDKIAVAPLGEPAGSPPTPLAPSIVRAVERVTGELWPGVPVVPLMSTGGTDGGHLRRGDMHTYGVSGLFDDIDDVRAHGKDERIGVRAFFEGLEFMYRLVKALSSAQ
jgi:acetylornithine deacetylase/succinyl-diaminopimelate desuccinylase-like protein